jgi:hypothetical protein
MELSVLAAKILAIVYISAGIAVLGKRITFNKIIEDFKNSQALTFVSGFMTVVIGVLLVQYHNIWVKNWTVLITVIGWMSLVKGVMLIAFPQFVYSFKGLYRSHRLWGIFMVVLGLLFAYLACS